MKTVNLPYPWDIEHDSGTDFGKSLNYPGLVTSAWGAEVKIQPAGDRAPIVLTVGSGITIVQSKVRFTLTTEQLELLARTKQGAIWWFRLISPDGVKKKYFQGTLTIR